MTAMLLERLFDNLALTVEAFATCQVARGWRLRLPALDWVTFHYAVQGAGTVSEAGGRQLGLPTGSLGIVPPHQRHALECGMPPFSEASVGPGPESELPRHPAGPTDDEGLVVICGRVEVLYEGALGLFDQLQEILVLDFGSDPSMKAAFKAIREEASGDRPGSGAMTSAIMKECLVRVFRQLCAQDDCQVSWMRALEDPTLAPTVEAMLRHPDRPHSVASLAAIAYMSRSAFARRFREAFGRPPLQYLREVRLRHAARLLTRTPHLPVATVARPSLPTYVRHGARKELE